MVKNAKKWIGIIVLTAVVFSLFPTSFSRAATGKIRYYLANNESYYTDQIGTALSACDKYNGGRIEILEDYNINIPSSYHYAHVGKNTSVYVAEGVTVTIGTHGLPFYGTLYVYGTLDLINSAGVLAGDGAIKVKSTGKILRPAYDIMQTDERCFEATDIYYGQTLGDVSIAKEQVQWESSVEGEWQFVDSLQRPQPGTRCYDIKFVPQYPLMYETKTFFKAGQITVRKSNPRCEQYEQPVIHVGETLLNKHPQVRYVNPYSGEEVAGTFFYDIPQKVYTEVGEQTVLCHFQPIEDMKYESVEQYKKITVLPTVPQIASLPVIRKKGQCGQTLEDITFLHGICTNPYSGEVVKGTWEWKDSSQQLSAGEKEYTMLFLPDESGYEVLEIKLSVYASAQTTEKTENKAEDRVSEENNGLQTNTKSTVSGVRQDEPSYVITQLVSRMSTIVKPLSIRRVSLKKVRRLAKKVKLSWKKIAGVTYEVQYSTNKKMNKAKKKTVKKNSTTILGLKSGQTYYVRVRAWKKKSGKRIYGKWSAKKRV